MKPTVKKHLSAPCALALLLCASGCGPLGEPSGSTTPPPSNNTTPRDMGSSADMPDGRDMSGGVDMMTAADMGQPDQGGGGQDMSAQDMGGQDFCALVDCIEHSMCDPNTGQCVCDAGYTMSGGACVADNPCLSVRCGANSTCQPATGQCLCDVGFAQGAAGCEPVRPGDPSTRTAREVCDRWAADYPKQATTVFTAGAGTCDPGTIDMTAHADAMRRVNLYRWLLGLDPASVDWNNQAKAQQAALMMDANNALSHSPPSSWQCYTADGAAAAGSSNLALGYGSPADTVDGYMRDRGTPSLGHRRWIISPSLGQVGFGHHGRGGAMWAFGRASGNTSPPYVMYPGPGPQPTTSVLGDWSISSNTDLGTPTVTITPKAGGAPLALGVTKIANNYGLRYAVSLQLQDTPTPGTPYIVTIQLANGTTWSHETTLIDCSTL